jgi:hypothetical protein
LHVKEIVPGLLSCSFCNDDNAKIAFGIADVDVLFLQSFLKIFASRCCTPIGTMWDDYTIRFGREKLINKFGLKT